MIHRHHFQKAKILPHLKAVSSEMNFKISSKDRLSDIIAFKKLLLLLFLANVVEFFFNSANSLFVSSSCFFATFASANSIFNGKPYFESL